MKTLRRAQDRGQSSFDWLQSHHSFSFGHYYDPAHMGVSALRVINDDVIAPGAGFDPHPHRDMEIISYVTRGAIAHRDSTGNERELTVGEVQLMSAGSGILHSEYNASDSEELRLLQIWIQPNEKGLDPGYQQQHFPPLPGWQLLVSPDREAGSLRIQQDAWLFRLRLKAGETSERASANDKLYYVHLVEGSLQINGETLASGDAITVSGEALAIKALQASEALVFLLPEEH